LVNYLDVLDAQRTMLAAEMQLAQTERARLTDMVGLYKALGGGWSAPAENVVPAQQQSAAR
jgi:multidrug efflux system outer membrane protein